MFFCTVVKLCYKFNFFHIFCMYVISLINLLIVVDILHLKNISTINYEQIYTY